MKASLPPETHRRAALGAVVGALLLGIGALLYSQSGSAQSGDRSGANYGARAHPVLSGGYLGANLSEGGLGDATTLAWTQGETLYAKKAAAYAVDAQKRTVEAPSKIYDVYVKAQTDDLGTLKLRACIVDSKQTYYCPTWEMVRIDPGQTAPADVTSSLTTTYTAPRGVASREPVGLFDDRERDILWHEMAGAKVAEMRLYPR